MKNFRLTNKINPIHPGEILLTEFMEPLQISQNQLARDINVAPRRVNEIVLGKRSITTDTSMRMGKYFKLSENFFTNLQNRYDFEKNRKSMNKILAKITPLKTNTKVA
jgi:addiction module HigA family antidote